MIAVAIDGPAGAGKSTIARRAARQLGFLYVDTGALYRAVGLFALRRGADPGDAAAVRPLLEEISVDLTYRDGVQRVLLCGEDVEDQIRSPRVSMAASGVSSIPEVRRFLLDTQRRIAREHSVVMDGRDIGTVVLPGAQVKIFLTASPEDRARRRYEEMLQRGEPAEYEEVLRDLKKRDYSDTHRAAAPLVPAEGAVLLDTTGNTLERSVSEVVAAIREKLKSPRPGAGNGNREKRMPFYAFARSCLPWLFHTLMPMRVRNAGYLPETGAVILCCNHASMSDPLRLAYSQRRQIYFMAKAELFENRLVAAVIGGLGAFPVRRGKSDKQAIGAAERHLKEGHVLGVFIEGTRSPDGNLLRPKPGAVMLAHACGAPILPCCITARGGGVPKLFRRCLVTYGPPIPPGELGIEKGTPSEYRDASRMVMARIEAIREENLREWGKKDGSR